MSRFALFAVPWAVVVLYSFAVRSMTHPMALAVVVAGVLVIARPAPWKLALLAVTQLAFVATQDRHPYGHQYVAGAIHLMILGTWLHLAASRRTLRVEGREHLERFAPWVVVVALLGLFCAGFSKLNQPFLMPDKSCAVALYLVQSEGLGGLLPDGDAFRRIAIGLALAGELGGSILLAFPRTRTLGFVLLLPLLYAFGLNPINHLYEFAGPFLVATLLLRPGSVSWTPSLGTKRALVVVGAVLGAALIVGGDEAWGRESGHAVRLALGRASWLLGAPALVFVMFRGGSGEDAPGARLPRQSLALVVVPLLLLVNESMPYMGFQRHPNFSMASGLQMIDGGENHLLVRKVPAFSGNRAVRLLSSSDPWLQKLANRRRGVVLRRLQDRLSTRPGARVSFEMEGVRYDVPRAGDHPLFQGSPAFPSLLRVGSFRWGRDRQRRCGHWPSKGGH